MFCSRVRIVLIRRIKYVGYVLVIVYCVEVFDILCCVEKYKGCAKEDCIQMYSGNCLFKHQSSVGFRDC